MTLTRQEGPWKPLAWFILALVAGYLLAHVVVAYGQTTEITKTCESVVVEIEGVTWEWPNTWLNGAMICYPGPPDEQREIVNLKGKTVTFAGSVSALRTLGVVP